MNANFVGKMTEIYTTITVKIEIVGHLLAE